MKAAASRRFIAVVVLACGVGTARLNGLAADSTSPAAVQLRCEYLIDPAGIDVASPRLTWMLVPRRTFAPEGVSRARRRQPGGPRQGPGRPLGFRPCRLGRVHVDRIRRQAPGFGTARLLEGAGLGRRWTSLAVERARRRGRWASSSPSTGMRSGLATASGEPPGGHASPVPLAAQDAHPDPEAGQGRRLRECARLLRAVHQRKKGRRPRAESGRERLLQAQPLRHARGGRLPRARERTWSRSGSGAAGT